jgi:carbon monoxide dehydrogenase subunit G
MKATAAVKIGPIAARFTGRVQLGDLDPPNGYTISGEGQGGVAGFAKGGAKVHLADDGAATLLTYDVKAQVGGKIAQLGARLIDASAKQMADQFFDRFSAQVGAAHTTPGRGPGMEPLEGPHFPGTHMPSASATPQISLLSLIPAEIFGFPLITFIAGGIFLVILLIVLSAYL